MAKKRDILLTVLFCGFIGAMAALTAFLPKQEVSVNEKRTLAKFPEFSVQKLFNGNGKRILKHIFQTTFQQEISLRQPIHIICFIRDVTAQMGYIKEKTGILLTHL